MPRALRFIFWERRRKKCRLPEGLARTLPDPVRRKRFLALDLVFILGISISFWCRCTGLGVLETQKGSPFQPNRACGSRALGQPGNNSKRESLRAAIRPAKIASWAQPMRPMMALIIKRGASANS